MLFTSEASESAPDDDLQFMSDGVIHLNASPEGDLSVGKFRGSDFRSGRHSMRLTGTGMQVFPRLLPEMHKQAYVDEVDLLWRGGTG